METKPNRFYTLDGMRGLAALLVVAYHLAQRDAARAFSGYLAVDLFFVLSGFVIALNYSEKLAKGLSVARFAELRVIRLFPLYLLGLSLGLAKQILGHAMHDPRVIPTGLLACHALAGAIMLPSPCSASMFPLNLPSWTLFFELLVNIAFALALWRMRSVALAGLMAVSAAYLIATIGDPLYFNVGWSLSNALAGVARTTFSFPAGILIFRLFPFRTRAPSWLALIPVLAMGALILIEVPAAMRSLAEALIVFIAFPLLVIAGIRLQAPRKLAPLFALLGDLSYPLYAIHLPLMAIAAPVVARLHLSPVASSVAVVAGLIPAAFVASILDGRVRAAISTRLKLRRTAPAQVV